MLVREIRLSAAPVANKEKGGKTKGNVQMCVCLYVCVRAREIKKERNVKEEME